MHHDLALVDIEDDNVDFDAPNVASEAPASAVQRDLHLEQSTPVAHSVVSKLQLSK